MLDNAKTQMELFNWQVGSSVINMLDSTELQYHFETLVFLFSRRQHSIAGC